MLKKSLQNLFKLPSFGSQNILNHSRKMTNIHTVLKTNYKQETESQHSSIYLGMGCFWGVERLFWNLDPKIIHTTSVGYSGGDDSKIKEVTYEYVCTGKSGHVEVVKVDYKKDENWENPTNLAKIIKAFWENHDPTQGDRQGNDRGTQYRSVIFCTEENQLEFAKKSRELMQIEIDQNPRYFAGSKITTEISMFKNYYYGEEYHQQYLDKNPWGYCNLKGNGVTCPMPNRPKN